MSLDLDSLAALTGAVEAGDGLPEVVRAAARALDASLVLIDRSSSVLAVAVRSRGDERALIGEAEGVQTCELRVGDELVGRLRLRSNSGADAADPALLRLVIALVASEVARVRAPNRAAVAARQSFLRALLDRGFADREEIVARATELGLSLQSGAAMVVVRAHRYSQAEDEWRGRLLAAAERAAHASLPGAIAAATQETGEAVQILVLAPVSDAAGARRVAEAVAREIGSTALKGFEVAIGYSRVALDPVDLYRASIEALLAANVAEATVEAHESAVLSFEDTGAYRLLLPALSEDPAELQRFYGETVEPIAAYDERYETDLVGTVEAFLECDGNVANTAARLFTHRHTIRYRLERVRDLSGLDVSSTDGREKLGLGLKAMRVLGIAAPRGPASERGARRVDANRERRDRA